MGAIGGPAKTLNFAGREFSIAGDADIGRQLGGFSTERQGNGDGSSRKIMTPMPWALTGLSVGIDPDREDQEFLEDKKNSPDDYPIAITYADDTVYSGLGNIEGELTYSNSSGTASFDLKGDGELKKQ